MPEIKERIPNQTLEYPYLVPKVIDVINRFPQIKDSAPQYLLAAGKSIDLITGRDRPTADVDLVALNTDPSYVVGFETIDTRTPDGFYSNLRLTSEFLSQTTVPVRLTGHNGIVIYCVHPAITLAQKCSPETPQTKGSRDAAVLYRFLVNSNHLFPDWPEILKKAFDGLPADQKLVAEANYAKLRS